MFFGFFSPAAAVLALEEHGKIAGVAASLSGTLQMLFATLAMTIGGFLYDGTPVPMLTIIAVCALGAFLFALITVRGDRVALADEYGEARSR
jgi:MFS transporter, DHA1 family, multidrug resistance protein